MVFAMKSNAMIGRPTESPQHYEIRVRGILDPSWSARLGGLCIAIEHYPDRPPETRLSGELPDQAALYGVLSALFSLGNHLLSVEAC
jgi:hypothetical protein